MFSSSSLVRRDSHERPIYHPRKRRAFTRPPATSSGGDNTTIQQVRVKREPSTEPKSFTVRGSASTSETAPRNISSSLAKDKTNVVLEDIKPDISELNRALTPITHTLERNSKKSGVNSSKVRVKEYPSLQAESSAVGRSTTNHLHALTTENLNALNTKQQQARIAKKLRLQNKNNLTVVATALPTGTGVVASSSAMNQIDSAAVDVKPDDLDGVPALSSSSSSESSEEDVASLKTLFNHLTLEHQASESSTAPEFMPFEMLPSTWKLFLRYYYPSYYRGSGEGFIAVAVVLKSKPQQTQYLSILEIFKLWEAEIKIHSLGPGPWKEGSFLVDFGSQRVKEAVCSSKRLAGGIFCGPHESGGSALLFDAYPGKRDNQPPLWRLPVEAFGLPPVTHHPDFEDALLKSITAKSLNKIYGIQAVYQVKKDGHPVVSAHGGQFLELAIEPARAYVWTSKDFKAGIHLEIQGFLPGGDQDLGDLVADDSSFFPYFKPIPYCRSCSMQDPLGNHGRSPATCPIMKNVDGLLASLSIKAGERTRLEREAMGVEDGPSSRKKRRIKQENAGT